VIHPNFGSTFSRFMRLHYDLRLTRVAGYWRAVLTSPTTGREVDSGTQDTVTAAMSHTLRQIESQIEASKGQS
jgi:hypothetical protein